MYVCIRVTITGTAGIKITERNYYCFMIGLFCSSLIFVIAFSAPTLSHLILPLSFALLPPLPPALSDFDSLDERDQEKNNQLGFDVAEREFGISPCMTGKEMSSVVEPDKLSMVMYLSQFYEMFKDTVPPGGESG